MKKGHLIQLREYIHLVSKQIDMHFFHHFICFCTIKNIFLSFPLTQQLELRRKAQK